MFIKILKLCTQPKLLKKLNSMAYGGYLEDIGWINSFNKSIPVNKKGDALPWVTYPFIDFISERLTKSMDVFEYGSGNSTLWYAKKVNSVSSIEHDKKWFDIVRNNMPENVTLNYESLIYGGLYAEYSKITDRKFDIIIVDGRDRVNSLKCATDSILKTGVIILDDSERERYKDGIDYLLNSGFNRIDFWGISPGYFYKKNTTIFYKSGNCLGI
ncbi:hypothetical protein ACXJY6_16085 [Vibrio sp. RC27]